LYFSQGVSMVLFVLFVLFAFGVAQVVPVVRSRLPVPLFSADSLWRRNVSSYPVSNSSFDQIQAAYGVLKGSTLGAPSPTPLIPNPPGLLVQVLSQAAPPIFGALNTTISVPQIDYSGAATGSELEILSPTLKLITPTFPSGWAVLTNNEVEMDLYQVTTFSVMGFSQGGGFLGPITSVGASSSFALSGSGNGSSAGVVPTGVPLLGGVLLSEDLDRGSIDHVLAVTWPQFRNQAQYYEQSESFWSSDFFPPAVSSVFSGSSWRQMALAAGCVLFRLCVCLFCVLTQSFFVQTSVASEASWVFGVSQ
jgi:hypothetical protein